MAWRRHGPRAGAPAMSYVAAGRIGRRRLSFLARSRKGGRPPGLIILNRLVVVGSD